MRATLYLGCFLASIICVHAVELPRQSVSIYVEVIDEARSQNLSETTVLDRIITLVNSDQISPRDFVIACMYATRRSSMVGQRNLFVSAIQKQLIDEDEVFPEDVTILLIRSLLAVSGDAQSIDLSLEVAASAPDSDAMRTLYRHILSKYPLTASQRKILQEQLEIEAQ